MSVCYILLQNQTPLHLVKNDEIADILILNGANVNSRDINVSMYDVVSYDRFK